MKSLRRSLLQRLATLTVCVGAAIGGCLTNTASLAAAELRFAEVPDACGYLSEQLASGWLQAKVRPGQANEHIPTFWSQCVYSGQGVPGREVGFVFKFMLLELFDTAALDQEQLKFNATFAAGGAPLLEVIRDLGRVSFAFAQGDRSMLLVVTGIQGPPDGAGRPQEFVASYQLSHPELAHEQRLELLLVEARSELSGWLAQM